MNDPETQRFNDAYRKFEAGNRTEALLELRSLAPGLVDPWDKAVLLYHEVLFLVDMHEIPEARQRLEGLKLLLASLGKPSVDGYQDELPRNLAVMFGYTEFKVLLAEKNQTKALQTLEELLSRYPKRLSTPGFHEILDELGTYRGFLMADADRWVEARPFLENASPPESWKSVLCYYLGHCYYFFHEYEHAESKLVEALGLGLTGDWECKARYVLGIVEYHLGDFKEAKNQFTLYLRKENPEALGKTKIWEWLEELSVVLGEYEEAEKYRKRRDPQTDSTVN
jgi:tetratricopeptide (TPR) repeat protein